MSESAPTILIVDDDEVIRDSFCEYFSRLGWSANGAADGEAALQLLRTRNWICDCIVLDKRMPKMDGLTFLETLRREEARNPRIPVIVLSAYVEKDADKASFEEGGVAFVFGKPQPWDLMEAAANAITSSRTKAQQAQEVEHAMSVHAIDKVVRQHEDLIEEYFETKSSECSMAFHQIEEPLLVVARRWNSWYPSFFNVAGGAYAIVFPKYNAMDPRNRVVLIDPGFRSLEILSGIGLSVQDMETCVVTHNHPDHLGGVFEYIACRNQAGLPTAFSCNPSTRRILGELANRNLIARELPDQGKKDILLDSYLDFMGRYRSLEVGAFATDHHEIGWDDDARGLILTANSGDGDGALGWDHSCRAVILGDTAFVPVSPSRNIPAFFYGDDNTKIAVLHIGSSQLKRRVGGHLYLTGLLRLLVALAQGLDDRDHDRKNKLVVLISEWGLEHATAQQIKAICPAVSGFDDSSAIVATISVLRNALKDMGYDRLTILPADIGLMVGMESGQIYLKDGNRFQTKSPDKVSFVPGLDGLEYS